MQKLTWREQRVLTAIHNFWAKNKYMPSNHEINKEIGIYYQNEASSQIDSLKKKGWLTTELNYHRSMSFKTIPFNGMNVPIVGEVS